MNILFLKEYGHLTDAQREIVDSLIPSLQKTVVNILDYKALARKLLGLQSEWASASKICTFLAESVGITSWSKPESFPWKVRTYPALTSEEIKRLEQLVNTLAKLKLHSNYTFNTEANQPSESQPDRQLFDGYTWNALFGEENMQKVNSELEQIWSAYSKLGSDKKRRAFIKQYFDIDVNDDWTNLPGLRFDGGDFSDWTALFISGLQDGDDVYRLWLDRCDASIGSYSAEFARMSLLPSS